MERKLTILKIFFENPNKGFLIREIARLTKINHITISQYIKSFVKEELLSVKKEELYPLYKLNPSKNTLNLKLYFNLEKIRTSGLIEDLEKIYDYPVVVLFGSYAKAIDDENSDVDLCVITNVKKELALDKYSKYLKRNVSLHIFNSKNWQEAKIKNSDLINNICNGIVLSGQLEVI
jgi:predicted nucleotidyltransferase